MTVSAAPVRYLRRTFERDTAGEWIFPLVVLSALYFFDEFDTAAVGTLAPEIQHSFGLSDQQFISLIIANISITALLAVPVGYLADRVSRTRLTVLSGILAGGFSLATGIVGTATLLFLVRLGNGLGMLANLPVHNSLLADYYTPNARAGVFANHTNAMYLGAVVGPAIAGGVGATLGWHAVFYILIIPILVVTVIATRLPEPARGARDSGELLAVITSAPPPPFRRASRLLMSVRTLRYQYFAAILFGAALIPLAAYLALYYERVFGLGPAARGAVGAVSAAATFVGVRHGGKWTPGWFAKGMAVPMRMAAYAFVAFGLGLIVVAASPWLWLVLPAVLAGSYLVGIFFAPYYAVQALVSPARVRTLSFSFTAIFLVIGVVVFGVPLAEISDTFGIRAGIGVLVPFWWAAAVLLNYSGRFVQDDANAALAALAADAQDVQAQPAPPTATDEAVAAEAV